ncbi:tyrosine-type recombinase/integrase [Nannocystis pusilla]|uniref:tyrosine-type recombinase/integrase n=1 Tax=Nannocystis pusilla TaxID=889268 RepID=UPI003DA621B2
MNAVDTAETQHPTPPKPVKSSAPKKRDRSPGPKVYKKKGAGFLIRWRYKDPRTGKTEEIKRKAQASTITGARQEARALEIEVLDSLTRDPAVPEPDAPRVIPTVAGFFAEFEAIMKAENKARSTWSGRASYWRNHVAPSLGTVRLDKVTEAHYATLLRHCDEAGLAPGTKRGVIAAFHRGLIVAKRLRYLSVVPEPPQVKVPEAIPVAYTPDESNALVDAGEGEVFTTADLAMLYCGLHGGMRRGEVCGLRGEDFKESEGGCLVVTVCRAVKIGGEVAETKSGKARTIALTHDASDAVRDHLATLGNPRGWLFPTTRSRRGTRGALPDRPVQGGAYDRCVRRLCAAAGVPYEGTHKSRKTAATALAKAGRGAWQIAGFLGHSGIDMAKVYVDRENAQDPDAPAAIAAYSGPRRARQR